MQAKKSEKKEKLIEPVKKETKTNNLEKRLEELEK